MEDGAQEFAPHKCSIQCGHSLIRFLKRERPKLNDMRKSIFKADDGFFAVTMINFDSKKSNQFTACQDKNVLINISLKEYHGEIRAGTAFYARGRKLETVNNDYNIDLIQPNHRFVGLKSKYLDQKRDLNLENDYLLEEIHDGKSKLTAEEIDGLDFKEFQMQFKLFQIISTEIKSESVLNSHKLRIRPKFIQGEAYIHYYNEFMVI